MPVHVAITRRVRPGCEEEFQEALRGFFQSSFSHPAVLGASMLVPPPGTNSREFGILRTFRSPEDRDAFYASSLFLEWEARASQWTEGDTLLRELHGLEAFFREPMKPPPPRWKMAVLTWLGVWPVSMGVSSLVVPWMPPAMPRFLVSAVVAAGIVVTLTWVVMPQLIRLARPWLHANLPARQAE